MHSSKRQIFDTFKGRKFSKDISKLSSSLVESKYVSGRQINLIEIEYY